MIDAMYLRMPVIMFVTSATVTFISSVRLAAVTIRMIRTD